MKNIIVKSLLGIALSLTSYGAKEENAQISQETPHFLSLADKVFHPSGWGLESYTERTPTQGEVDHFCQWVHDAVNRHGSIQVILGDRGSIRFRQQGFEQAARGLIFVDSSLSPDDPYTALRDAFGVNGTFSDFLTFIRNHNDVQMTLREKISLIFDDWSLIFNEQTSQLLAPFHFVDVMGKIDILDPLLIASGRIFTSSSFLTLESLNYLELDYDMMLCKDNVRRYPALALTAPVTTDENFFSPLPRWVVSPRRAVIDALNDLFRRRTPQDRQGEVEALAQKMGAVDYLQDLVTFFFADGRFGDRFVMLERKTVEEES